MPSGITKLDVPFYNLAAMTEGSSLPELENLTLSFTCRYLSKIPAQDLVRTFPKIGSKVKELHLRRDLSIVWAHPSPDSDIFEKIFQTGEWANIRSLTIDMGESVEDHLLDLIAAEFPKLGELSIYSCCRRITNAGLRRFFEALPNAKISEMNLFRNLNNKMLQWMRERNVSAEFAPNLYSTSCRDTYSEGSDGEYYDAQEFL